MKKFVQILLILLIYTSISADKITDEIDLYKSGLDEFYQKNFESAKEIFDKFVNRYPSSMKRKNAELKRVQCLYGLIQWDNALNKFDLLIKEYSDTLVIDQARWGKGIIHYNRQNYLNALRELMQITKKNKQIYYWAKVLISDCFFKIGMNSKILPLYDYIEENSEDYFNKVHLLFNRITAEFRNENCTNSSKLMMSVLDEFAGKYFTKFLYVDKGDISLHCGNYKDAVSEYTLFTDSTHSKIAEIVYRTADAARLNNDFEQEIIYLKKLENITSVKERLKEYYDYAVMRLGDIYFLKEEYNNSLYYYQVLSESSSDSLKIMWGTYQIGVINETEGRYVDALKMMERTASWNSDENLKKQAEWFIDYLNWKILNSPGMDFFSSKKKIDLKLQTEKSKIKNFPLSEKEFVFPIYVPLVNDDIVHSFMQLDITQNDTLSFRQTLPDIKKIDVIELLFPKPKENPDDLVSREEMLKKQAKEAGIVKKKEIENEYRKSEEAEMPNREYPFTVQVAARQDIEEAEAVKKQLVSKGIANVYVIGGLVEDKGYFYRVRIGRFKTYEDAKKYIEDRNWVLGRDAWIQKMQF